jgi:polar amino acid transport system permease protein
MNFDFLPHYLPLIWSSTLTTLALSIVSLVVGGLLGLAVAMSRILGGSWTNHALSFVVDILRTTPLLVQILFWYLGPAVVGISIDPFVAAVLALSVNAGAYISEIVRGAVLSVPRGQREAAVSVGLSPVYSVLSIEMPQALPAIIPALVSFYIGLIKDTSLAYIIGLLELTSTGAIIANTDFRPLETYLAIAAIYFAICFPISRLGRYMDRRMRRTGLMRERLFV